MFAFRYQFTDIAFVGFCFVLYSGVLLHGGGVLVWFLGLGGQRAKGGRGLG